MYDEDFEDEVGEETFRHAIAEFGCPAYWDDVFERDYPNLAFKHLRCMEKEDEE